MAVQHGHEAIVDLILEKGDCNANIREFDHGEAPLHIAALVSSSASLISIVLINTFAERI